jgi:hypothetical protein
MKHGDDPMDEARRRFLTRALGTGLLVGGAGWNLEALAAVFGRLPGRLPPGKSIFEMSGEVSINGKAADMSSLLKPGDVVRTGRKSHLIGVIGEEALILRSNTELEIAGAQAARKFFRLVTGAMLTVFGKRKDTFDVRTPVATIGVRGTGLYAESDPEKTYLCTCYGKTKLRANADPSASETIEAQHHDAPRYILAKADKGKSIVPAGFIDHTDLELMTLEALVGREVPFKVSESGEYLGPRREY